MEGTEIADMVDFYFLGCLGDLANSSSCFLDLPCLKHLVHVGCCGDIMPFVAVLADGPLHWADDAITYVFAKLWLRKVIPRIENKVVATDKSFYITIVTIQRLLPNQRPC